MSASPDDTQEWARAIQGDGEAFAQLFDRHRDRITRHSQRLVMVPHDVDDVVAVTFLEAWRKREQVRLVNDSILPWLLVTATNTAQNLRRGTRRYRALLARLPEESAASDDFEQINRGPASEALNGLALHDRQVLVLCVLEGFTTEETAAVLGIPAGTVKSRLSRAKRRLAQLVAPQRHPSMTKPEEAQ